MSLVIIDYGVGNLASIQNMLRKVGVEAVISSDVDVISGASKIILAGIGAFDHCMQCLIDSGLINLLNKRVVESGVPVLGICVGMQMLTHESEEGRLPGLKWINGKVVKFKATEMSPGLKIPHMGWTNVTINKPGRLLENMDEEPRFYFAHSYHAEIDDEDVLLHSFYGYRFAAAVEHNNILGVQFHPEKSHRYGMQVLTNFVKNY